MPSRRGCSRRSPIAGSQHACGKGRTTYPALPGSVGDMPPVLSSDRARTRSRGRHGADDPDRGEPRVPFRAGGRVLSRLHRRGVAAPGRCSRASARGAMCVRRRLLPVIRPEADKHWIARPRLMLCVWKQRCCTSTPTSSCTDSRTATAMQRSRVRRRDEWSSSNASVAEPSVWARFALAYRRSMSRDASARSCGLSAIASVGAIRTSTLLPLRRAVACDVPEDAV
jgi:hypothetical protein